MCARTPPITLMSSRQERSFLRWVVCRTPYPTCSECYGRKAEVDGLDPRLGIIDVPALVDQVKEAGLDVLLTLDDVPTDLPARVDLSIYRIVQEALTNVLKHAGPGARAEVTLGTDRHGHAIEVLDDGHGVSTLPGSGHGIVGMRERALLLGGSLDAGPRPGGGFQVVAHLPIGDEQA